MNNIQTNSIYKACLSTFNTTSCLLNNSHNNLDDFTIVLQGILRKDYYKLKSIMILCDSEFTGDAVLDLSRGLLEDMISIEYIKLKGEDKMSKKFITYSIIEHKQQIDFLIRNKGKVDKNEVEKANKDYNEVKDIFRRSTQQISHSWAMCNIEEMIEELFKKNVLQSFEKDMILQAYKMGNKKNHLSPLDILSYTSQEFRAIELNVSINTGLFFSLISFLKIASEFSVKVDNHEVTKKITEILLDLNKDL